MLILFFTAGLRKCVIGGGVGLGLSALYCLYSATMGGSNKISDYRNQYM